MNNRWLVFASLCALTGVATADPRVASQHWESRLLHGKVVFTYDYPKVVGLADAAVEQRLNDRLKAVAMPTQTDIKDATSDTGFKSFSDERHYRVGLLNGHVLSVAYYGLAVRDPSAHPSKYANSVTVDLKTGRDVQLADLFKTGVDYKNRIKNMALNQTVEETKQKGQESLCAQAFSDGIHFFLEPHKLVIYNIFDSYAMESISASIDTALLRDMAAPHSPIASP